MKTALTIAGSDSSGGAGIQADIKTMLTNGVYAMSAVTALTAQNTQGVRGILPVPPAFLRQQMEAVFDDIRPDAVKIGMVCSPEQMLVIADCLRQYRAENVVIDPVMVSSSGTRLMDPDAVSALLDSLCPVSALLTPNLPEAELLSGQPIHTADDMRLAAERISRRCGFLRKEVLPGFPENGSRTQTATGRAVRSPALLRQTWQRGFPCRNRSSGQKNTSPLPLRRCWTSAQVPAR